MGDAVKAGRSGLCLGAGMAVRRTTFDELGGFDGLLGAVRVVSERSRTTSTSTEEDGSADGPRTTRAMSPWCTTGSGTSTSSRVLVARDLFGVGGGVCQIRVRTGRLGVVSLIGPWLWRFGIAEPFRDLAGRRRPRGFRRPIMLMRGLMAGLRTPLDRETLMYENNEASRELDRRVPNVDG